MSYKNESTFWMLVRYIKLCGISGAALFIPVVLSLLTAFCEGLSLSLLAPTLDFAVQGVVDAQKESWLVSRIRSVAPDYLAHNHSRIIVIFCLLIMISESTKYLANYHSVKLVTLQVNKFASELRKLIFKRYLSFGKFYFDNRNSGELHQVLTTHTRFVAFTLRGGNQALCQFAKLFVYGCMMFAISWQLAVMTLLFFPILHFSAQSTIRKIKESSAGLSSESNLLGRNISNALSSISLVKLYGQEEMESERFNKKSDELLVVEDRIAVGMELLNPIRDFVVLISIFLLVGMIWYVRTDTAAIGMGKYLVFILVLRRSAGLFGSINQTLAHLAEVDGPLREIHDVVVEAPKSSIIYSGPRVIDSLNHKIEIRGLNFKYSDESIGLKDINLVIEKGDFVALVGRSGAGKTTLMNVLARYYDCEEGTVFVDGVDIREYSNISWRSLLSIVSQDASLFEGSIRENLVYGLEREVTEDELLEVLEHSCLLDMISSLANGLETLIGERGVKLSAGEKQRLSIARAFLRNPEIVILDEPTSGLDSQTEEVVQKGIAKLCKDRTVIVIAHRLATIREADHVVVMNEGRIEEQGTLDALIGKEEFFYKYWKAQQL